MRIIMAVGLTAVMLSGCSTTAATFYRTPSKPALVSLCRSYLNPEITDQYRYDLASEIVRRGAYVDDCQTMVTRQNIAIGAVAAVAVGVAIGAACANGACPTGGTPTAAARDLDYDCANGGGDGPRWQYGPIAVGSYDPYDLDRDGDGIGCEIGGGDYGA